MALEQKRVREVDGSISLHNFWTPLDGDETIHVMQTGPVVGTVILADGTAYDVTAEHIQVRPHHVAAVNYHIAKMHEASGHLTRIVHGLHWAGSPATVVGDESGFEVVPGTDDDTH